MKTPLIIYPKLFQLLHEALHKSIQQLKLKNKTMSKTLDVTLENALEAYKSADAEGKKLLINLFGENHFKPALPAHERITTLEAIIAELGEAHEDVKEYRKLVAVDAKKHTIANAVLTMVAKVYNTDQNGKLWIPDWTNSSEYKWYPYFKASSSGVGFSYTGYDVWRTYTHVGSRLCFKTENVAHAAVKNFESYYNDFLTNN